VKVTDYAPRAAPFDSYLKGRYLVGAEIGVDVGAHAQALLQYCNVAMLHLVDIWPNAWCRGYCEGRLNALGLGKRYTAHAVGSHQAAQRFEPASLDFIYVDQEHDLLAVSGDLMAWWPLLKSGGVLGYRNYTGRDTPLDKAVDAFLRGCAEAGDVKREAGELVLFKRA